jgi:hypothetical protein
MLLIKSILILGFVLVLAGVSVGETVEPPDSTISTAPRKNGLSLGLGYVYESYWTIDSRFDRGRGTFGVGFNAKSLWLKPGLLAYCEKMASDLDEFQRIKGVPAIQEALSTGVEFVYFYKDFTTYGNPRLHTGMKFPGIESRNLKTGIFFKF